MAPPQKKNRKSNKPQKAVEKQSSPADEDFWSPGGFVQRYSKKQLSQEEQEILEQWEKWRLENEKFLDQHHLPEILTECTQCHKWRKLRYYFEQSEVPKDFDCSMWTKEDGEAGSCEEPGETEEPEGEPFAWGEVVWAKVKGYSWYPGMIEFAPETLGYYCGDEYHVTFFAGQRQRGWTSEIKPYEKKDPEQVKNKTLKEAIEDANDALSMRFPDRIRKYSVAYTDPFQKPTKKRTSTGSQNQPTKQSADVRREDRPAQNCFPSELVVPDDASSTDSHISDNEFPLGLLHYSSKTKTIKDWGSPSTSKGCSSVVHPEEGASQNCFPSDLAVPGEASATDAQMKELSRSVFNGFSIESSEDEDREPQKEVAPSDGAGDDSSEDDLKSPFFVNMTRHLMERYPFMARGLEYMLSGAGAEPPW